MQGRTSQSFEAMKSFSPRLESLRVILHRNPIQHPNPKPKPKPSDSPTPTLNLTKTLTLAMTLTPNTNANKMVKVPIQLDRLGSS